MTAAQFVVMKFGGTSVATAERLVGVADLIAAATRSADGGPQRVVAVASAAAGVTNLLIAAAHAAAAGELPDPHVQAFADRQAQLANGLRPTLHAHPAIQPALEAQLAAITAELAGLLRGVWLLRDLPATALAHISGLGERASCACLHALLQAKGLAPVLLDPVQLVPCSGDPLAATPNLPALYERFATVRGGDDRVYLMAGFFGGDARGKVLSLGRGGSDWSGALAAYGVDAQALEIWTDVDGIASADPRQVDGAVWLTELSFDEAMELAHFGAKVLHPKTIAPARAKGIPVRVCNTFAPHKPGSWIRASVAPPEAPVRGITLLDHMAMLTVSGPGMPGVPGVAARVFGALAARTISVIFITQASSECTLSLCVPDADADAAEAALAEAFALELESGRVDPLELRRGLAILSVVGEGMRTRVGVAGTFLTALGQVRCNVVAIAQGSTERSISVVIERDAGQRALRHVHHCFFHTREVVSLVLCGIGTVGKRLLEQLGPLQQRLADGPIALELLGVATSRQFVVAKGGLPPERARALLLGEDTDPALPVQQGGLDALLAAVSGCQPQQPILLDCTSSAALAKAYPLMFASGLHVVSASKHANSMPMDHYLGLRRSALRHRRQFRYETNVGAGLPVMSTLRSLLDGGDAVLSFDGILSGSLSLLAGLLQDGVPLSAAVLQAKDAGFTEPDPRDDLSGLDVARKVLILARESGLPLELTDVDVQGFLPADFDASGDAAAFLQRLPELDPWMAARQQEAANRGEVLRYVAHFSQAGCSVGWQSLPSDHPLAAIRGGENAFSFLTRHYQPRPLVVRGYGAGAAVTASGVLGDALLIARGALR